MNQKEIAKLAGVSTATVSRVINRDPAVSPDKAKRVQDIIDHSGYVSNAFARNLRTARSMSIALIAPRDLPELLLDILPVAQDTLLASGYRLLIFPTSPEPGAQMDTVRSALSFRVDGILLYPSRAEEIAYAQDVPMVTIGTAAPGNKGRAIGPDDETGMALLLDYAIDHGHRHIAFLYGDPEDALSKNRLNAFLRAYQKTGLKMQDDYIRGGAGQPQRQAYLCAWQFMALDAPPTVIIGAAPQLTIGCYKGLIDQGISLPDGMSLLSYGDFDMATHLSPPITAFAHAREDIGLIAADALLSMLSGNSSQGAIKLPGRLEERASCARINVD